LSSSTLLRFFKFGKLFEVYTIVSNFAFGGMLMQNNKTFAYESKKMDGC
jgi:hypothetical protein